MNIKIENLSKYFKDNLVISDVNIEFNSGNIYGFYGKNGSGKSVLLKIICGLYKADQGNVKFNDKVYNYNNMHVPNLRALIEKPSFFPNLTGYENLKLLAKIQDKISDKEILQSLQDVNLFNEKDKKFSTYSLGMKQKLGIAQVFMENPDIIILDEPFNGVDVDSKLKIIEELKQKKEDGKLIIITTHDKKELNKLSDEIYQFENGKIKKIK